VHRETVNIGVIGRTQAGKSTLLRTITGLGPDTNTFHGPEPDDRGPEQDVSSRR
jgi:ABC-type phosphate/phosphonate transport system ATPase subunit